MNVSIKNILSLAKNSIEIEILALQKQLESINDNFIEAVHLLSSCSGRVIVSGIGKSGHIAQKAAATFSSLGCPAFFLHASEACHGDIGMVMPQDVLLLLSYSGTTSELLRMIQSSRLEKIPKIAITGSESSPLAKESDIHCLVDIDRESCTLNLAPTASALVTLALCDALAVVVSKNKKVSREDFAVCHPSGNLGRRLKGKVRDLPIICSSTDY